MNEIELNYKKESGSNLLKLEKFQIVINTNNHINLKNLYLISVKIQTSPSIKFVFFHLYMI